MRDIFFQELRECNKAIKNIKNESKKKQGYEMLQSTIAKMCELALTARKGGLLALEDAAYYMHELNHKDYLNTLVMLIVDGTAPELVEELGTAKYFAAGVEGVDALQYLIILFGCLAIQAGENHRIIEEKLLSIVPVEVVQRYKQKEEQDAGVLEFGKETEIDSSVLEKYYKGDIAAKLGDEYFFQLKVIDYAICSLDDRSTQRWLRDVDNGDLALALKGLSGNARKQVFNNLSERLAIMMADDMESMGNVKLSEIADAALNIFNTLLHLIKTAEVVCKDVEVMATFLDIME